MAKHEVTVELPVRKIERADVKFKVKENDVVIGTLEVSKGSVVWFPRGTSYGCKMRWQRFDAMMQDSASRVERRRS